MLNDKFLMELSLIFSKDFEQKLSRQQSETIGTALVELIELLNKININQNVEAKIHTKDL